MQYRGDDVKLKQQIGPGTGSPRLVNDRERSSLSPADADALIRSEFSELRGSYLDVAARGPLPLSAQRAAESILRAQSQGSVPKEEWLNLAETVRAKSARLLGARPDEIALTKNTSEGLNIVAAASGKGWRYSKRCPPSLRSV